MVDSYTSAKLTPYTFEIDEKPYMLPGLPWPVLEDAAAILDESGDAQMQYMKKLIADHSDKRTETAIRSLGVSGLASIFKRWIGVRPGESESSPESSAGDAQS